MQHHSHHNHNHTSKEVESLISQEAYELVTDPTRLLSLLYSKYGDIDEDYNYMYINPLLYSKSSHILSLYKEYQYMDGSDEYLKRFYAHYESEDRLPRLSEYYKNYHIFFCRPVFRNWALTQIMHSYGDNQAEIFYKNNYANNDSDKRSSRKRNVSEDESLSSLDNITNNKTIFDKKIRCIIESNKQGNNGTNNTNKGTGSTLTLDVTKGNCGLISKRSKNNSFVKLISGMFVAPKAQKQNIKVNTAMGSGHNSNSNHCVHNGGGHKIKAMRMKSSLCTLTKAKIEAFPANCNCNFPMNGNGGANSNNNNNNNQHGSTSNNNNNKILLSPKLKPYLTTFKSNFAEFNKNKPKYNYNNYNHYNSIPIKNKTSYNNNNNNNHNHNNHNNHLNNNHNNTNHPNKFSKLSTSNTKNSLIATMTMPPANGASLNSNTISINGNPSCTNRRIHSNISSTLNSGISSTLNSAIHNNNNTNTASTHQRINSAFQAKKNKTYDIQYNNTNHNTRLHKATKTKYKTSSLSKISPNTLKTPLSKTTSSSNNTILHPSSSLPRYSSNSKPSSSTKNSAHAKRCPKDLDSMSYSGLLTNQKLNVVQSQRCASSKNNGAGVKSPTMVMTQRKKCVNSSNSNSNSNSNYNSINSNAIYSHGRGIFNSRNKKTLQKNIVQTIRSSKCKNTTNTNNTNTNQHYTNGVGGKSVDDKKEKQSGGSNNVRKLLSELTAGKAGSGVAQEKKYEMSDKLINQIEELIKKAKFNSASGNVNNNNYHHHQHSKSNGINENNSGGGLEGQIGNTNRGSSMKPINVNLNANLRMKSSERKSNVRMFSPKI